ncbi:peptidase MA family metallohydrolase [Chloroflexota bacterium]
MPNRIFMVILLVGVLLGVSAPARANDEILTEPTKIDYTMGGSINFETRVLSEIPAQEVWVFMHPQGDVNTILGKATMHPSNVVTYKLELSENPIRAYSRIEFWYQITLEDGTEITTEPETFVYFDNRFEWQTLAEPPFNVFWYEGDIAFGQEILNTAQEGMLRFQNYVPVPPPTDTQAYVYASATELQTALRLSGQTGIWIAGHADPDMGVVVVTIPPGPAQTYEIKRQIPHEIAHLMLYHWLGEDYYNLPQWLREGLPSMAELFPNPDYALLLDNAYETESLLPMETLCENFPLEASNFLLAYAQSADFAWFLYENYGSSGLEALSQAYADGLSCEQGAQQALGKSLTELDREWRKQTFGENTLLVVLKELLPWIVLFGVILVAPLVLTVGRRRTSEQ